MNILVLVTDAYGGRGGIAKFNRDLLAALSSYDATDRVRVWPRLVLDPPTGIPHNVEFEDQVAGSKLRYAKRVLSEACSNTVPDVIICGHIYLAPFAALLAARFRRPWYLILHGIEAWTPPPHLVQRTTARKADGYIAVTDYSWRRFMEWSAAGRDKVTIIPNCVDKEGFAPGPKPQYLVQRYRIEGRKVIMTLGRLAGRDRAKGFDEVLEALPKLPEEYVYLIAGDGSDRHRLEEKARRSGIGDRIIFTGYLPEHEKADHYRVADAYAMPSRGEGFGIVFLEAMACGIPVVASSEDGGIEAVRGGELGEVVDPNDRAALIAAITRASEKEKSVPVGLEYFHLEAFVGRWHSFLDSLAMRANVSAPVST